MSAQFKKRRTELRSRIHGTYAVGDLSLGFDSNLFYLTGLRDRACLVISAESETLYVPERSAREIAFDGAEVSLEVLTRQTGIEQIRRIQYTQLHEELQKLQAVGIDGSLRRILAELRWVKDADEQNRMRKAAHISRRAHDRAQSILQDGFGEWELRVEFERELFLNGCRETAYTTISAAGEHANTLHYIEAEGHMRRGGVVLLDGGGKFGNYAADITSTWVVGETSEEQARVFEIVRYGQDEALKIIKPGVTMNQIQARAEEAMAEELLKSRIIENVSELKVLFPHKVSHWIGLDVHDPKLSTDDGNLKLQAGVTLTLEPGLYFSDRTSRDYGKYSGIGARFEEDILVTTGGSEVLSRLKG